MRIKENTIQETDGNGKVTRSFKAKFINANSDENGHVLTAYSTEYDYEQFFFDSKKELEIMLNTFETIGSGSFWTGTENMKAYIEFVDIERGEEMPKCNEYHNATIEEGHIYEFTGCGHVEVIQWMSKVDGKEIFCPRCGKEHVLNAVGWADDARRLSSFNTDGDLQDLNEYLDESNDKLER